MLPRPSPFGSIRLWRFQRLHTQAITGSGSQTGNGAGGGSWPALDPFRLSRALHKYHLTMSAFPDCRRKGGQQNYRAGVLTVPRSRQVQTVPRRSDARKPRPWL